MIADTISKFSETLICNDLTKYAKLISIPKYKSDGVYLYNSFHLIKVIESNDYWYYETSLFISSSQLWDTTKTAFAKAYYTSIPQNDIIINEEDDCYAVYAKCNATGTKIFIQVLYSDLISLITSYTGSSFNISSSDLTSQKTINYSSVTSNLKKVLNNNYKLIDNLTGNIDSLNFVNSINMTGYKYDCPVSTWAYDSTTLASYVSTQKLPNNLQCFWNVSCTPMIGTSIDDRMIQAWEGIVNGVYYKYIRYLNEGGTWSSFIKII